MTKKRFTLREPKVDGDIGCSEIANNGEWITYGEIVDLLNENEELKHELLCKQLDKAQTEPINCKCHYDVGITENKRFTTVELPKPNKWGIWYDEAYLSTNKICILLNEYVDVKKMNEELKIDVNSLLTHYNGLNTEYQWLKEENNKLKSILEEMKDKNGEIWLMDGRIIRLKKVLKE